MRGLKRYRRHPGRYVPANAVALESDVQHQLVAVQEADCHHLQRYEINGNVWVRNMTCDVVEQFHPLGARDITLLAWWQSDDPAEPLKLLRSEMTIAVRGLNSQGIQLHFSLASGISGR